MNFLEVSQRFEQAESGTDSFKILSKDTFQLMTLDPENAGLYFLIGTVARAYVRRYEDQGVSPAFADQAKTTVVGYTTKINQALSAEPMARLRLLGEVAIDYEWHMHDF